MNKNTKADKKLLRDDSKYCVNCKKEINSEGICETYECFFEGRKAENIQSWEKSVVNFHIPADKQVWPEWHIYDYPILNSPVVFRIKDKSELNTKDARQCLTLSFINWTEELYKSPLFSNKRKENASTMMIEIDQMIRYDLRGDIFDQKLKSILAVFRDIYVLEGIFRDMDACWTLYVKQSILLDIKDRYLAPTSDMLKSLERVKDLIEERLADMKKIDQEHGGSYTKQERLKKEKNLMTNKKTDWRSRIGPNEIIGRTSKEKNI